MKSVTTTVLGMNLNVPNCPETATEYDEMSKAVGACVETAVDNDLQHGWKGRFRKAFLTAVEKETGIARKVDAEGKPTETEKVYWSRANKEGHNAQTLSDLIATVIAATPYQATGSSGKIGESWLKLADSYLETVDEAGWDRFVENIVATNPGFTFDYDDGASVPTRESIALALKVDEARIASEARASRFGG
jgi:hypothetical protein